MEMIIPPSYDVEMRHSLMRWKEDDETFLLVLVLAPEILLIIRCDQDKVLCYKFGPSRLYIVLGLKSRLWTSPWSPQP